MSAMSSLAHTGWLLRLLLGVAIAGGCTAVVVLLDSQVGFNWVGWLGTFVLGSLLLLIIGFFVSSDARRDAVGAGVLAVFGSVGAAGWIWFGAFFLFPADPSRACVEAIGFSNVGPEFTFERSYLPPALICFPHGALGEAVIATPLASVLAWSVVPVLILGLFILALLLTVRSRPTPPPV
jgi:hypothetical protein